MNEEYDLLAEQLDTSVNVLSESDSGDSEEIEVYVLNDSYSGTISETYLDYFTGIVDKLGINDHYVIWRSGQYEYIMAYGSDLSLDGYYFSGNDLWITKIWRESGSYSSDWYCTHTIDSINVDCTDLFAYTDLGNVFPTVKRGWSSAETSLFIFAFFVCFIYVVLTDLFKYVKR